MTALSAPPLKQKFYDVDGVTPLAGGRVFTYATGTTTPQATYSDYAGTSANSNPVILDANGEATIYLTPGVVYDFLVRKPSPDNTITLSRNGVYSFGGDSEFKQDGTGAVTTTVNTALKDWLSVTQFGAVGNGSTDDTTAFVNACAGGKPVYVPKTSAHYALTALTDANLELLWGPGRVKVASADVVIPSTPRAYGGTFPSVAAVRRAWAPDKWPTVEGSLQNGAFFADYVRTGGFGTYGNSLNILRVTAATPATQLDTAETAWLTHNNLTGGQAFGAWFGANSPAQGLGQTFSSGAVIGLEVNAGNRWADLGLQSDIGGTRYTVGIQIAADVLPASDGTNELSVSGITIASPGVVTVTAHGLPAWTGIVFSGAGTLPTGLVKGQLYFVSATGLAANTFQVASTVGGTSINTTGTFAGPITVRPSYAGSFGTVTAASVWGHRWWVGNYIRADGIMAGGHANYWRGGSIAGMAPASAIKAEYYWGRGIDFRGSAFSSHGIDFQSCTFTGAPINFDFTASNSTTATAGSIASPGNFQGFIKVAISGSIVKVPYFNN
jgi:hypothetical protein